MREPLSKEDVAFLREYAERDRKREISAEEMYEMEAAFGPGAVVVNVISGRKITLPGRK